MWLAKVCSRWDGGPSTSRIHHTHPVFLQAVGPSDLSLRQEAQCGPRCSEYPPASPRPHARPLGHKRLSAAYLGGWVEVVVGSGRVGRLACWGVWRMAVPLETDSGRMVAVVGDQAPSVG